MQRSKDGSTYCKHRHYTDHCDTRSAGIANVGRNASRKKSSVGTDSFVVLASLTGNKGFQEGDEPSLDSGPEKIRVPNCG